jgi:hypothetical protein
MGANPNIAGTPVMVAACRGYLPLVKQLVAGGADLTIADEQGGDGTRCNDCLDPSAGRGNVDLNFIQARR